MAGLSRSTRGILPDVAGSPTPPAPPAPTPDISATVLGPSPLTVPVPGSEDPRDLLVDSAGAPVLAVDGDLRLNFGATSIAQDIAQRLRFFSGEWFLDTSAGVPWLPILGQRYAESSVRTAIRTEILATPGVSALQSLDLAFDASTRELSIAWSVSTDYGPLSCALATGAGT